MTISALADDYGVLSQQIKALEAKRDEIKKKLAAYKSDVFVGSKYTVKRCMFEQSRLDTTAIRADMGEAWVQNYTKTSTGMRLTVSVTVVELEAA